MLAIEYQPIGPENFSPYALDAFDRTQQVNRQWRRVEGQWQWVDQPFTDDWSLEKKRQVASELLEASQRGGVVWGAFTGGAGGGVYFRV